MARLSLRNTQHTSERERGKLLNMLVWSLRALSFLPAVVYMQPRSILWALTLKHPRSYTIVAEVRFKNHAPVTNKLRCLR